MDFFSISVKFFIERKPNPKRYLMTCYVRSNILFEMFIVILHC